MPYQIVVDILSARYNTPHRNLSLQSEVDSQNFDDRMFRHNIQDEKQYIHRKIERLNNIAPKLVDGFHTESNEIKDFSKAEPDKKWTATPLKSNSTVQSSTENLEIALNEGIQLECEIKKASISSKNK